MAKIIKLTDECLEKIKNEFAEHLSKLKLSDGKFSFTKSFDSIDRKATIYFKEVAWIKMQSLIREVDKEVGWHGVAYRGTNPEKDEYIISDILVYPQEVTGVTVTTDQEKYQMWLMTQEDDVFNNIRMQGHSHVNMGTTPSGVDNNLYDGILSQLEDDMFYIFMIWNKRGEKTIKLYDLAKNVLFETSDCTVKIVEDETGIEKFLREAKEMVIEKTWSSTTNKAGNSTDYPYGYQHTASSYGYSASAQKEEKQETKNEPRRDNALVVKGERSRKTGVRMGRKKGKKDKKSSSDSFPYDDNYWETRYYGYY